MASGRHGASTCRPDVIRTHSDVRLSEVSSAAVRGRRPRVTVMAGDRVDESGAEEYSPPTPAIVSHRRRFWHIPLADVGRLHRGSVVSPARAGSRCTA